MATLKDISKATGLSVTTVSRALNGFSDVSVATRQKVQSAADALNYRPNEFARQLVTGKSGMLGLVIEAGAKRPTDPFVMEMITGLSAYFSKHDRIFVLHVSNEADQLGVYRRLVQRKLLDGFVLISPTLNDPRIAYLRDAGLPFAVHGRDPLDTDYAFYDIDNYGAIYDGITHLTGLGHRRIALLNCFTSFGFAARRLQAYRDALEQADIPFDPALVFEEAFSQKYGRDAVAALYDAPNPPTAIHAGNLRVASGVYGELAARGLRIPEDVSVFSHDDLLVDYPAGEFNPPLSATYAPIERSYAHLAEQLSRQIDGEAGRDLQVVETPDVVLRASTAAPRAD